jgi:hypothetical protein
MDFLKRFWRKIVAILTTPIDFKWLFTWRKRPKAAEQIVLVEPEPASLEPKFLIPPLDTRKYRAGPRFVIERRRRAMKAGKIPGPTA